jgi:hypothetical protein
MSFSPTTTAQPGNFFACLTYFVTESVQFFDNCTPVALFNFVFGDYFTILQQFAGHCLRVDQFNVITHFNTTQTIAMTKTISTQTTI